MIWTSRILLSVAEALLVVFLALVPSCKKSSPIGPPPPGPDTTTHAANWQTLLFGGAASSFILDVSIVNDTLAYAVGKIYVKDSTGATDLLPYNFLRWNGKEWSLERQVVNDQLTAVYAFAPDDIWAASGGPFHWDGKKWSLTSYQGAFSAARVYRFGGKSSQDLYMGGDFGQIAHFNGSYWEKVETGTTLPVKDIFGAQNPQTGTWEVLATASDQYGSLDRKILKLNGLAATIVGDAPVTGPLTAIWFAPGERYYVAGAGIYQKASLSDALWQGGQFDVTTYYVEAVRGMGANDIFAVGDFGEVVHYNGQSWHSYRSETALTSGLYHSVAYKGNLVIAVGEDPPRAVILVGRRGG